MEIVRTDSHNPDFIGLVKNLDADLAARDGSDHSFYVQFNKIESIKHAVVAYEDGKPVGCGAIKEYDPATMEVKRMYTLPQCRGKGIASTVLAELKTWSAELSIHWYDVWFPNLAPGLETMKFAHAAETPAQWAAFAKKYRSEMSTPDNIHAIELLAVLSHTTNFSVGCYCENESHCHRSVLRELLIEHGAELA